ncbi:MAG: hypothetical protein IPK88_12980 [Saprospiraceae bacterium]|nr:hypothetical protein [Candidatus Defluviibacterium haderslevense]
MTGAFSSSKSPAVTLALDLTSSDVVLNPAMLPTGAGILFVVINVSFLQEVNGQLYALKTGSFNAIE